MRSNKNMKKAQVLNGVMHVVDGPYSVPDLLWFQRTEVLAVLMRGWSERALFQSRKKCHFLKTKFILTAPTGAI